MATEFIDEINGDWAVSPTRIILAVADYVARRHARIVIVRSKMLGSLGRAVLRRLQ